MLSRIFSPRKMGSIFPRHLGMRYINDFSSIFGNTEIKTPDIKNMPAIKKELYKESTETSKITKDEVEKLKKESEILTSLDVKPIREFDHLPVERPLVEKLKSMFQQPTPIQQFTWPLTLSGRNLVGLSVTGSGKTISFGVPMMHHILKNRTSENKDYPLAMILLPTWELTHQVHEELSKLGAPLGIRGSLFVGGESLHLQIKNYNFNRDFIVGTPGRLNDVLQRRMLNASRISFLVIDEADRLIDMGFTEQIDSIIKHIRPDRMCTLWSATWPRKVSDLAVKFVKDPAMIKVGSGLLSANKDIKQELIFTNDMKKMQELKKVLDRKEFLDKQCIVFSNTKMGCNYIADELSGNGISVVAMHSDKDRNYRKSAFESFKNGDIRVLVATDVASRGLDLKGIELIVLYDFPREIEDYVHRIGRTARAGKKGTSVTFFTVADMQFAKPLEQILIKSGNEIPEQMKSLVSDYN